jgi:glycosyltransferase involved in cell wall biosynthesis
MTPRSSGATQRFKGLYREVFRRLDNIEFVVYEPRDCVVRSWFDNFENVRWVRTDMSCNNRLQKHLVGMTVWPGETKRNDFDIFESLNLPIIDSKSGQNLLTIHDIGELCARESRISRRIYRSVLSDSIRRAQKIIAVSETARGEILSHYPTASIEVVYNGINAPDFESVTTEQMLEVKKRLKLPQDFVLTVGHFERRKNYPKLVEAAAWLRKMNKTINFVVIGNDSGELATIRTLAGNLGVADSFFIFSGLSDSDVRAAYRAASLLVFPSTYEGFGIPAIEAMAARIPMVLSNIAVFKEITQGKGCYFDPNNSEEMAATIERVVSSTAESERLIEYAKGRVGDFSFANAALKLEKVYADMSRR